jgi:hypothetical protein
MALVPLPQLEALEASIQRALTNGAVGGPEVIGYGEITSVVRLRSGGREFACKRLVPFPEPDAARRADRWWHRHALRRPYPYLLPPRIERGL